MDVRHSADPQSFARMSSSEIRSSFLLDTLFAPEAVRMIYADHDRAIVGAAVPGARPLPLQASAKEMAATSFTERREIGIINIGGEGSVSVGGKEYAMGKKDCLYVGRGAGEVVFGTASGGQPPRYYFVSYPAHAACPTTRAALAGAESTTLGSPHGGEQEDHPQVYPSPRGSRAASSSWG